MKPCFGYIRVSTQKQGEGVSLEAQRDAITVFASQHDLKIIKWFEEKETAAKRGRPIFTQMLSQLKAGQAEGVIIHKIDRSARNLRDWALFSELPDEGIDVFVATESLDFNSRGGRLTADIQAVIATDYIRNLREECIKGMNGRLKQGLFPWGAPPGYLDQGGGKPKKPCPKIGPLIRLTFELYATRQYSYDTLLEEMHTRGLRNRRGGKLTLCGLGNILQNPFYVGLIHIKKTGQTYDGIHKPLVSMAIWKQVQKIRAERSGPKSTRHNHLFQGIFRCGHCDNPMVPEKQKGHVYYRCKRKECPTKTVREEAIEAAICRELQQLQLGQKANKKAETEKAPKSIVSVEEQRSAFSLQIADQTRRLEKLEDLLIDETIDPDVYQRKSNSIRLRIKELEELLTKMPDPAADLAFQAKVAELRKNLVFLYEIANRAEKRLIIENVWPNRKVTGKKLAFEPYSWVIEREFDTSLLGGAPERYRGRTFSQRNKGKIGASTNLLNLMDTMISRIDWQLSNPSSRKVGD